jgi:predicted Zn-dependent protease
MREIAGSDGRILSREECQELLRRAHALAEGGGETQIHVTSWWHGELRWGRNRVTLVTDRRNVGLVLARAVRNGVYGSVSLNQLDDRSLEAAVRAAEWQSRRRVLALRGWGYFPPFPHYEPFANAAIWSDATFGATAEARAEVARRMISRAKTAGMLSAGYLEVRAATTMAFGTEFPELRTGEHAFWEQPYVRWTQAQGSMTVRNAAGTGSGWAGLSSYDWLQIERACDELAERAVQKCIASQDPVALEPGRYTVILEPQAVADLMDVLVRSFFRELIESQGTASPWHLGFDEALRLWRTKLGMKVVDERVTIGHDPADPRLGIVMHPLEWPGPVTWIERGVLKSLGHGFRYAMEHLPGRHALRTGEISYSMAGGDVSIDEMIRTTRRGLLVSRFWNVQLLDGESLLSTGYTRDGLWLIENGQITKAVKNLRFTESPLFVLNNLEALGEAVPVFRPTRREGGYLTPAVVPAIKARDFSFTSPIDAI